MYWLRAMIASLAAFSLVYLFLSSLLGVAWNLCEERIRSQGADLLFALRMLPLLLGYVGVMLFVLPSYLFYEPRSSVHEHLGGLAWGLTAIGIGVFSVGFFQVLRALYQTSTFIRNGGRPVSRHVSGIEGHELTISAPVFFVAGIWRPRLFFSQAALKILDAAELRAAIRHEAAHATHRDNLKQLLLRGCSFPALHSLDRAWLRAAEIAADDASVRDEHLALELASALLQIAKLRMKAPALGMSLAPESDAPLNTRIRRLLQHRGSRKPSVHRGWWATAVSLIALTVVSSPWIFTQAHEFTEMLFR